MARSRSRSMKLRRSTKKCDEGQIAVRGRMSKKSRSRSPSYCRSKSVRKVLECEPEKIKVRSHKTKSGKRSPAHCRTKTVRKPFICPPGTIKVKGSLRKGGIRVKAYCRTPKYAQYEESMMLDPQYEESMMLDI